MHQFSTILPSFVFCNPNTIEAPKGHVRRVLVLVTLLISFTSSHAQDEGKNDIDFTLTGALQPRLGYGHAGDTDTDHSRFGFGMKRARIDATVLFGDWGGVNYDGDLAGGAFNTIDVFAFYRAGSNLRIRVGYFPPAQPRAFILTSFTLLDSIDRPAIAERWAAGALNNGRDFGVDATFTLPEATLMLGVHNGNGDLPAGNYRDGVSNLPTPVGVTSMAYSFYLNRKLQMLPGLEIGGYASYNGARSQRTAIESGRDGRAYTSWSGHLYWGALPGSQQVRLKVDLIGTHYSSLSGPPRFDSQRILGVAFTGAVRVLKHGEFYARFEHQHTESRGDIQFIATGISYSYSARADGPYHRHRITLGYQGGFPQASDLPDSQLIILQKQLVF